jgi:hypothetical protein
MIKPIGQFSNRIVFILCMVVIVALATGVGAPASAISIVSSISVKPTLIPIAIPAVSSVTITGIPQVGSVLTAVVSPSDAPVTAYEWNINFGSGWKRLSTGTSMNTYTPVAGDVGGNIGVIAWGASNTNEAVSPDIGPVTAGPTTASTTIPVSSVTITGIPQVGSVLTAVVSPSDAPVTAYEWNINFGSGWKRLSTGTSMNTYTPVAGDVGGNVGVIAWGASNTNEAVSPDIGPVTAGPTTVSTTVSTTESTLEPTTSSDSSVVNNYNYYNSSGGSTTTVSTPVPSSTIAPTPASTMPPAPASNGITTTIPMTTRAPIPAAVSVIASVIAGLAIVSTKRN